jgi:hypothetical protein
MPAFSWSATAFARLALLANAHEDSAKSQLLAMRIASWSLLPFTCSVHWGLSFA